MNPVQTISPLSSGVSPSARHSQLMKLMTQVSKNTILSLSTIFLGGANAHFDHGTP